MELCRHAWSGNFISCSSYFVLVSKWTSNMTGLVYPVGVNRKWGCFTNRNTASTRPFWRFFKKEDFVRGNDLKIGKILGVDFFMTGRINLPKCYVERPFSASRHAFFVPLKQAYYGLRLRFKRCFPIARPLFFQANKIPNFMRHRWVNVFGYGWAIRIIKIIYPGCICGEI